MSLFLCKVFLPEILGLMLVLAHHFLESTGEMLELQLCLVGFLLSFLFEILCLAEFLLQSADAIVLRGYLPM